jgi:uncharacterized protein
VLLAYSLVGCATGLLAGMLGVGGGLVVVPALLLLYDLEGVPADFAVLSAIGTSLGAICFTSASSALAHHRRKAVDWRLVGLIAPGVVAGSFLGTFVATALPTTLLRLVFVIFLGIVCARMLRRSSSGAVDRQARRAGAAELIAAGSGIGTVSALVGIGGGSLTVPYLLSLGTTMHRAVGTSAAVGFPIAVAGAAGYALQHGDLGAHPHAIGFIYLPALLGIAIPSMLFAPLGARLAHALPVAQLRRAFAVFLLIVAAKLAVDAGRGICNELRGGATDLRQDPRGVAGEATSADQRQPVRSVRPSERPLPGPRTLQAGPRAKTRQSPQARHTLPRLRPA